MRGLRASHPAASASPACSAAAALRLSPAMTSQPAREGYLALLTCQLPSELGSGAQGCEGECAARAGCPP